MKKIICLVALCSVLGGCMAAVTPRGELYASYRVPVRKVYVPHHVVHKHPAVYRRHHPSAHEHGLHGPHAHF